MHLLIILACVIVAAANVSNTTEHVTTIEPPTNSTKEILKASETADPTKAEIVKQIRRLNEDGSYTIGYEANDGTFKIESRDVLGNVKGTFGYVDDDGEIKRVTYSSSSDSTPVSTSTTPTPPTMVVRMNKTISSTTRRPLGTIVYPTRSSATTRGTVIQAIPRRRPISSSSRAPAYESTTEKQKPEETTVNVVNIYRKEDIIKARSQLSKPVSVTVQDDLVTKQTTTPSPQTLKPVYEHTTEKEPEATKSNTIRRELSGTSSHHHMVNLQQSMGDDSTDVYGGHLSHGTIRPLFTTTTIRSRLVPIQSLAAARRKIQQQFQDTQLEDQETTIEASTGRVFEHENVVTSNPVPVVHIPAHRSQDGQLYHQQPIYHRPTAIQFRTQEYLRDNPGAPIPIGNQRPFLSYEYQDKVLDPQYVKEAPQAKSSAHEASSIPYEIRPVTRIIPIPVDERGVPIQGYEPRFVSQYRPQQLFRRYDPVEEMHSISAPVSTRDFKRLLHILILRQNRLQSIMDQIMPGPPYQPIPYREMYRRPQPRYQDDDQYDYRYEPQYRQDVYSNQVTNYDDREYESQRYVPRRRYSRPYDAQGSASNHIEESPEYLPVEVREALLLKMLLLAINPDYMPTAEPATELTTAAPPRKQVRNVQILGEEGSTNTKTRQKS